MNQPVRSYGALVFAHTDPEHGQYACIGYSEGQACCIDSIRPDLAALIQRLREAEELLIEKNERIAQLERAAESATSHKAGKTP